MRTKTVEIFNDNSEIAQLMTTVDDKTRRLLEEYLRLKDQLVRLTGQPAVNEAFSFDILAIADIKQRTQAARAAKRIRGLSRIVFSSL